MARRSARIASAQQNSSPSTPQSSPPSASRKRKAEPGATHSAKRGKKNEKEQATIEDSMDIDKTEPEQPQPEHPQSKPEDGPEQQPPAQQEDPQPSEQQETKALGEQAESKEPEQTNGPAKPPAAHVEEAKSSEHQQTQPAPAPPPQKEAVNAPEAAEHEEEATPHQDPAPRPEDRALDAAQQKSDPASETNQEPKPAANGEHAVEPHARDDKVPSSILEKGIMYFFYRGRVNIDSPDNVKDIARSYLILRPLPHGAKLSDGPIGDDKVCRLIAIPKKMLPLSGKDRWTAFVETSNTSLSELKESFLKSNDYQTQSGPRHTPAATPAAEAVYAITTTGRESHLAYITTLPDDLGQIQNDLGLRPKGSFIVSTKNPKAPGPANADIGKDPGYSQDIMDDFRSLRWAPLKPAHLNYEGCQFLMVGEGEQGLDKATAPHEKDGKEETPKEELEKLEGEDELRVEHLNGNDAIFEDLGTNAKDYSKLQTTW